jgi:histidinol-phosphate aminotransferase
MNKETRSQTIGSGYIGAEQLTEIERARATPAFHGGKSFEAIGEDFCALEHAEEVVNADVLDAWFEPSPRVTEKLKRFLPFLLRTSPPVHARGLIAAVAQARGLREECILAGGGSSDLIFTCLPRLIPNSARAMILDPTYGEYRHVFQNVMGLPLLRFELHKEESFRIDTDRLIDAVDAHRPAVIAIVNPNSPTGQHWQRAEAIRFLNSVSLSTLVVLDETYIEYAGASESLESEACARPNLIVVKSMSKVYALSGARVGYMVATPSVIGNLAATRVPWAVGLPAQVAAVEALRDPEYYCRKYSETHTMRCALISSLQRVRGIKAYPSTASFLLVETQTSAQDVCDRMQVANVFVRNCDSMSDRFRDRFLRIAVKTPQQNRMIAAAFRQNIHAAQL